MLSSGESGRTPRAADDVDVLLVEDEPDAAALSARWLERDGLEVATVPTAEECLSALRHTHPKLVCLDLELPGMSGLEALARIVERYPQLPVLILTASREVESVVRAMQIGARDYLAKPLQRTRLVTTVRNSIEHGQLRRQVRHYERLEQAGDVYEGLVGRSAAMRRLFRELDQVAASDVTVLVHGESGTGKELVARAVHNRSARADGPFVAVNCAALPENLVESELFGSEKGAYTGATTARAGDVERANGGTLFLDEIGELPLLVQPKLLRVLQEHVVRRLGAKAETPVDFRLVAATHRNLWADVEGQRFREDLFYRVAVFELEVPPLRERPGDIPLLARHLLAGASAEQPLRLTEDALAALERHAFPGNVRELQNALQRAAVMSTDGRIELDHLPPRLRRQASPKRSDGASTIAATTATSPAPTSPRGATLEEMEREALRTALERCQGNVAQVVRELGIGRTTVYRKLKKYGLR